MNQNIEKNLIKYNNLIKENDELYRDIAKIFGLPDCAFWILYVLRENHKVLTQSEICNMLYQPKQTVNSSLKKLEYDGFIELTEMDDRRSKQVRLTEKGITLAKSTVDNVILAEYKALSGLTEEEQNNFILLFQKYTNLLKNIFFESFSSASTAWQQN